MNAHLLIIAKEALEEAILLTPAEDERSLLASAHANICRALAKRGIFVGPIATPPLVKLIEANKLTLLFHSASPWTDEKRAAFTNGLTVCLGPAIEREYQSNEATTRNLCDAVRAALVDVEKPHE